MLVYLIDELRHCAILTLVFRPHVSSPQSVFRIELIRRKLDVAQVSCLSPQVAQVTQLFLTSS
jgi:hypothetical protein